MRIAEPGKSLGQKIIVGIAPRALQNYNLHSQENGQQNRHQIVAGTLVGVSSLGKLLVRFSKSYQELQRISFHK